MSKMIDSLELAKAKLTNRYLAEYLELSQAESLYKSLKETTAYLERRISREKRIVAEKPQSDVLSTPIANPLTSSLTT